ncbi:hypothetical protein BREVNS_1470 [Brevinematales bacterium NS]|nr:hypothetical protein BREVNS_1470 [Brevinematales bacterium NS]
MKMRKATPSTFSSYNILKNSPKSEMENKKFFYFFHKALPRGTKGALSSSHATHATRTDSVPLLRAIERLLPLSRGSPSSVGDLTSSS